MVIKLYYMWLTILKWLAIGFGTIGVVGFIVLLVVLAQADRDDQPLFPD